MTKIRCNRCQGIWETEVKEHSKFRGQAAARVYDWFECPHCGQTDNHWIYASDIMPIFEGTPVQIKRQRENWLNEN